MRVWTFLFSLYFCVGFERSGDVLHMIKSVRAHAEIGSNGVWRRWTARLVRLLLLDRFGRFSCREDRVQARGQSREPNQIQWMVTMFTYDGETPWPMNKLFWISFATKSPPSTSKLYHTCPVVIATSPAQANKRKRNPRHGVFLGGHPSKY